MEGVPLAGNLAQAVDDPGPCGQGGGFGAVGAVVGNDVHVPELLRVVLVQYAADEAADDGFLVPSGGQDGEAVGLSEVSALPGK